MRRINVTSGSGASRTKSKFKPIEKPLVNSYFDVGGELALLSNHAILREKDLATGSFTGNEYKLNIKNIRSNLPSKYKDIKSLEVVCRIRSQRKEIKSIQKKTLQHEDIYQYRITHFYHISAESNLSESTETFSVSTQKINTINSDHEVIDQDESTEREYDFNSITFEYVGEKNEVERRIADELCRLFGGDREVFTPEGERIDLLTNNFLVEVKASSDWDNAVGQILKYKIYFPDHKLIIFIFASNLDVEVAKKRLIEVIDKFIRVPIHIVTSVRDLKNLVNSN